MKTGSKYVENINKKVLRDKLDILVLPKKGKLNRVEREEDISKIFVQTKRWNETQNINYTTGPKIRVSVQALA